MTACAQCNKQHKRKRFCSNKCKDRYHNTHNPRGYGLAMTSNSTPDDDYHHAGLDGLEAGWDGHKEAF